MSQLHRSRHVLSTVSNRVINPGRCFNLFPKVASYLLFFLSSTEGCNLGWFLISFNWCVFVYVGGGIFVLSQFGFFICFLSSGFTLPRDRNAQQETDLKQMCASPRSISQTKSGELQRVFRGVDVVLWGRAKHLARLITGFKCL